MGVIERIGSLAGTEMAKAVNLAHETFQDRVGEHGHTGRALVETLTQVCRDHPNVVGIGVGLMVEQVLVHEKHLHEAREHAIQFHEPLPPGDHLEPMPASPRPARADTGHPVLVDLDMSRIKPGKIAFEVFGALVALKVAAAVAHMFGRKSHREAWFAPAARIHAFSAAIAAWNLARAIRSKDISSWRNAAIALFGTHAVKPLLKVDRSRRAPVRRTSAPPPTRIAPAAAPQAPPQAPPQTAAEEPPVAGATPPLSLH